MSYRTHFSAGISLLVSAFHEANVLANRPSGTFPKLSTLDPAHLICGVKTNVVTAVEILDKDAGDAPQLPELVKATHKNFTVREVSADKAYTSGS
jgi:hypothetical protein